MSPIVLRLRTHAPDWQRGGAKCFGIMPTTGNDPWFDNSDDGFEDITDEGVAFCNGTIDGVVCPLREECLLWSLVNNHREGVFGGLKPDDRKLMRKIWPWDPKNPNEAHPEWKFRAHEELVAEYEKKFARVPVPEELEEPEEEDLED